MSVVGQPRDADRPRTPGRRGSMMICCAVILAVSAALTVWLADTPGVAGALPGQFAASVAQLSGLLASVLVCLQLLLVSRIPWLARVVGLGPMGGWHRLVGSCVLILIGIHVPLAVLGGMLVARRTLWSGLIATVIGDPEILQALIGTALIVAAGLTSARIARSRLRYEWWYAVHLTVYAGIFLSFGHQVHSGVHFIASAPMRTAWTAMYLLTGGMIVLGRVVLPLAAFLRHRLRVERVVRETADVVSVWLGGAGLHRLRVRPGQFFFVRFLATGQLWTAHPYSVSSLPESGLMRFTIAAAGDHSAGVGHLKPGTRVLLEGPFGTFGGTRPIGRPVLLVAGGSAVGPIVALARDLCRRGRDVVLIHRASSEQDLPLREEVAGLELNFLPLVGRRQELGHDPLRPESLAALVPDVAAREVFICGSAGLVRSATSAVQALGVPVDRIHREELNLA